MRDLIDLLEGSAPGILYTDDDVDAVGYWYHPRTGQYHVIAWSQADNIETFSDHCDVALDHLDWFGLDPNYEYGDCEEVRVDVISNGWIRIGYNNYDKILRLDGNNQRAIHRAFKWFLSGHPEVSKASIDLHTGNSIRSFMINGDSLIDYESNGRLDLAFRNLG